MASSYRFAIRNNSLRQCRMCNKIINQERLVQVEKKSSFVKCNSCLIIHLTRTIQDCMSRVTKDTLPSKVLQLKLFLQSKVEQIRQ